MPSSFRLRSCSCACVFLVLGLAEAVASFARSAEGVREQACATHLPDGIRLDGRLASIGDIATSPSSRGDNFFALKASFWFSPN